MTIHQPTFIGRQDLLLEQAAAAVSLDRELHAVHQWSYSSPAPDGSTLEDHLREIRLHATTIRAIDALLERAE